SRKPFLYTALIPFTFQDISLILLSSFRPNTVMQNPLNIGFNIILWQVIFSRLYKGVFDMPMIGHPAPQFTAPAVVNGGDFKDISLSDFKGQWVVLFFYPLDFTFVCPTELLQFCDQLGNFKEKNAV